MISRGSGGSIILTSSVAGLTGVGLGAHYSAAKHGVVGLMRTLAVELAQQGIRVNSVHPTTVETPMVDNPALFQLMVPTVENPTREQVCDVITGLNAMKIPWIQPVDVSNAVLFLASDESRYITGVQLPVDAGATLAWRWPHA